MKNSPGILVVGSANTDLSVMVDHLPRPGETILGGKFVTASGGKGANQAVGAARAGGRVIFLGCVGRDAFGDKTVTDLAADGIDTRLVIRDASNPSGVALIFVDRAGENSIAVASGSNGKLTPADLRKSRQAFADAGILVLQLEVPLKTVEAAAELAAANGLRVILNPAPAQALPASLLRRVSVLTPNETETEVLTGIRLSDDSAIDRAAAKLLAQGVENVVFTLGARGVRLVGKAGHHKIAACPVRAVDTTAAGDVFNGALATALAEGQSLPEAARFANAAAAISVTRPGAQTSAPNRREIESMLAASRIEKIRANAPRNGHSARFPLNTAAGIEL